jgi:hypothetical protein
MKRLHVKFIKWLANKFGYKIAMIKISSSSGIKVEGDKELLRYVTLNYITGYSFEKDPLKKTRPEFIEPHEPIKSLTPEQLKELGITPNN